MLDLSKPKPKVLIATPHLGEVSVGTMKSILALFAKTNPDTALLRWEGCSGSNIAENQNVLVDLAQEMGVDWLLFVESDMIFPGEALTAMLSHGKDIIGCSYPFKHHDLLARNLADQKANLQYMGHELDGSDITFRALVEGEPVRKVEFVPMGLTLISMHALNTVQAYRSEHSSPPLPEGMRAAVFAHSEAAVAGRKRTLITTTDSTFCHNARLAGLDIWLDARISLMVEHIGICNYGMLPQTWAPAEVLEAANA